MRKELRLQEPNNGKHVLSFALDLLLTILSTFALYFLLIYSLMVPAFKYNEYKNVKQEYLNKYSLNVGANKDYSFYEEKVKSFYFDSFKDQIVESYKSRGYTYNEEYYTIEHIYNVEVLMLPLNPTTSSFENTMFSYVVNDDGTFNVDTVGLTKAGSGKTYEKNLKDIFYNAYNNLPTYLQSFVPEYQNAIASVGKEETIARTIAFTISIAIFYVIIPLTNKYGSTLFNKKYDLGYVDNKTGYLLPKTKIVLRGILESIIPLIGLIGFSKYTIIVLCILPYFIDFLMIVFTTNHGSLWEKIFGMECVEISSSLIFGDKKEEETYFNAEVEDKEFMERLENIRPISDKSIHNFGEENKNE